MSDVARLVLADGRVFEGLAFGARATVVGEVVFNTSLTGYQEILSDASYAGQLVCLTVSEVGNVGCNDDDEESAFGASGLLIRSLSPVVSGVRGQTSLPAYMAQRGIVGAHGLDTRALTRHIRAAGAMPAVLSSDGASLASLRARVADVPPMEGQALATTVSTKAAFTWQGGTWGSPDVPVRSKVVVWDFGVKRNILRALADVGVQAHVVPAHMSAHEILAMRPDGVVLSNGPGDPSALVGIVQQVRALLANKGALPVLGICLGHQLLALAQGGRAYKLPFGHHGGNHPVRDVQSGRVAITSQNHGFAVEPMGEVAEINLFDGTVAGLRWPAQHVWSVQYHPEAAPGPLDARGIFATFAQAMQQR